VPNSLKKHARTTCKIIRIALFRVVHCTKLKLEIMKTIWKYQLKTTDEQEIEMPLGAKILTVQTQYDKPCIWCEVFSDPLKTAPRTIKIFGTGHPIEDNYPGEYIGTYQIDGGNGIFHVFDRGYKIK